MNPLLQPGSRRTGRRIVRSPPTQAREGFVQVCVRDFTEVARPGVEEQHPVGDLAERHEIVGHHDGGHAVTIVRAPDSLGHVDAHGRVQTRRGFVVEDQLRPEGQGARQRQPLLHAAGHLGRPEGAR